MTRFMGHALSLPRAVAVRGAGLNVKTWCLQGVVVPYRAADGPIAPNREDGRKPMKIAASFAFATLICVGAFAQIPAGQKVGLATYLQAGYAALKANQPPPSPRFEVVSVKENQSVGRAGIVSGPNQPGKYSFINMPLAAIITTAFNVKDFDLVGLPGWTRTTRYDVIGTYPEGANPQAQHLQMIQNVLADRFQLMTHRELIERTVYKLVLARADRRLGPMLVPSSVDCVQWRVENKPQSGAAGKSLVSPSGLRDACTMSAQRNWMSGGTQPISLLALLLQSQFSARVVDQTGLTGNFDIDLAWVEDQDIGAALPGRPANASAPLSGDLFTAVEEQLGLKLEPSKERVDVLVIDSVERPTPD